MRLIETTHTDKDEVRFTIAITGVDMRELPETMRETINDPTARISDRLHAMARAAGWLEAMERV